MRPKNDDESTLSSYAIEPAQTGTRETWEMLKLKLRQTLKLKLKSTEAETNAEAEE